MSPSTSIGLAKPPLSPASERYVPSAIWSSVLLGCGAAKSIMPAPAGNHKPDVPFHHAEVRLPVTVVLDDDRQLDGTISISPREGLTVGGVHRSCILYAVPAPCCHSTTML